MNPVLNFFATVASHFNGFGGNLGEKLAAKPELKIFQLDTYRGRDQGLQMTGTVGRVYVTATLKSAGAQPEVEVSWPGTSAPALSALVDFTAWASLAASLQKAAAELSASPYTQANIEAALQVAFAARDEIYGTVNGVKVSNETGK